MYYYCSCLEKTDRKTKNKMYIRDVKYTSPLHRMQLYPGFEPAKDSCVETIHLRMSYILRYSQKNSRYTQVRRFYADSDYEAVEIVCKKLAPTVKRNWKADELHKKELLDHISTPIEDLFRGVFDPNSWSKNQNAPISLENKTTGEEILDWKWMSEKDKQWDT